MSKKALQARIVKLEDLLEEETIRSNLYLEVIAKTRDLAATFVPAMVHSSGWAPLNKLLTDTAFFNAEVRRRLDHAREAGWRYTPRS